MDHTLSTERIPHVLTEILPADRNKSSFVLNVYSAPKERRDYFGRLFTCALKEAKERLIILVAFNAAHPTWGYQTQNPKGRRLALTIGQQGLTILTDPTQPTRVGTV
ncbi:hypothetical protein HPB48_009165 [Haemaphysalis longicornis]|uniref:Endonuclease/exonuclease/phosphatase domain-containing protein n=1 Tax=Haemaphysalis longicornis TaxID=44386 RepID=A0A9J6GLF6_HAELO|nr:hypothetical protein HPB48_009165 [Haemaphysalis longicornis]